MMDQQPSFFSRFPPEVQNLLGDLFQRRHYVTLIGGGVRDSLFQRPMPADLDFEWRSHQTFTESQWEKEITEVVALWTRQGKQVVVLPFGILRVIWSGGVVEFASPREEKFRKDFSHKNFTAKIDPTLPYEKAFIRRDFTSNALGVEIQGPQGPENWVDPFQGRQDLQNKILRPCGPDFFRDPVRFLRAIRFALVLGWDFAPELQESFSLFNLSQLGPHYFLKEGFRSRDFLVFFERIFSLSHEHRVQLPSFLKDGIWKKLLKKRDSPPTKIKDQGELVAYLLFPPENDPADVKKWCKILGIKEREFEHGDHYARSLNKLVEYGWLDVQNHLTQFFDSPQSTWEAFQSSEDFKMLGHWWGTRKRPVSPEYRTIFKQWEKTYQQHLIALGLEEGDGGLQGKKEFLEFIRDKEGFRDQALFALYCHFKVHLSGGKRQ